MNPIEEYIQACEKFSNFLWGADFPDDTDSSKELLCKAFEFALRKLNDSAVAAKNLQFEQERLLQLKGNSE